MNPASSLATATAAIPVGIAPSQVQEELGESVPPSQQVLPGILAGPEKIAQRFLRGGWDEDGGQFSQAVEPGEFFGVLAVGLDAVSGFSGDERGGGDVAFDAPVLEKPAQLVPAGACFVNAADRGMLCELSGQSLAPFGGVGKLGAEERGRPSRKRRPTCKRPWSFIWRISAEELER